MKHCLYCGADIPYNKRRNKFCNSNCSASYSNHSRSKFVFRLLIKTIKKIMKIKALRSPYSIKNHLLKLRGVRCEICGITIWCGKPVPLVLDHIDGNFTNCNSDNLRLVCHNCDALLPTFAGRNRGNGRFYRRQRYATGKSS